MKCYSIFYQPWKAQNNTINIGGVINLQMGHVYNETPCISCLLECYFPFAWNRWSSVTSAHEKKSVQLKSVALDEMQSHKLEQNWWVFFNKLDP